MSLAHRSQRTLRGIPVFLFLSIGCNAPIASTAAAPDPAAPPDHAAPPPITAPVSKAAEVAAKLHHGIDVSSHSGTCAWHEVVADGHTFAFAKATEGMDLRDPAFAENWREMKAAGVIRGAYHFYVTEDDPETQAKFFIETVTLEPGDLAPVVDVETIGHGTSPGLADRLRRFLEIVAAHYGVKPIIYTAPDFWDQHLDDSFGDHPLWVAEYDVEAPRLPAGWSHWHLWQWQGDAEVAGVEHSADRSRVNRDGPDLSTLIVPARAEP